MKLRIILALAMQKPPSQLPTQHCFLVDVLDKVYNSTV